MEDYKYTYKDPKDSGYIQFKLTRKQHNKLFPKRKVKWFNKYEYYYDEHRVILHGFTNWKGIIINTISFPAILLLNGVVNFKEVFDAYKKMYNEKKYGRFTSESIGSRTDKYKEIMKIIKDGDLN